MEWGCSTCREYCHAVAKNSEETTSNVADSDEQLIELFAGHGITRDNAAHFRGRLDRQLLMADADLDEATQALSRIEQEVCHVSVPLSYAEELYDLRLHINLVKEKLEKMRPT